ncbi:MAG: preprotein translocase subunit SecE [Myxococcales bacterium]|nr:preprotein translocase subunit SecE [Myxococcales bacterium]
MGEQETKNEDMASDAKRTDAKRTDATLIDAKARKLGLIRWVQVAYMVFALFSLWLFDKVATIAWGMFAEPDSNVVTLGAAVVAAALTLHLYRHEKINRLTHDVVGELSKVTWPSRDETTNSTVVVIITSIIAALILGGFDAVWSAITDLIYKV